MTTPALVVCGAFSASLCVAVLAVPGHPWLGAVAVALAMASAGLALVLRPVVVGLAVAAALAGLAGAELPPADPALPLRAARLAGTTVIASGLAADDPRPAGGGYEVLLEPDSLRSADGRPLPRAGNLLVRARGSAGVAFGDRLQVAGRLRLPDERPGFDRRAYLSQRQVWLELAAARISVTAAPWTPLEVPSELRGAYQSAIRSVLPEPHASVLLGVVLGIRGGVPPRLAQALQATGLVHLLVLSGLKVAVFARLAEAALTPLLGRWSLGPLLGLVGLYALAGGATPAAVRSAAMGGLTLLAARLGRPAHVWTSLAAVGAAMLAWRPELAWDVGFQLSFLGTAAIVVLTPPISTRLRRVPAILREPFAVTCAAQVGTLPLTAATFHVLSPVAPLANALVLPLLPILVGGGLLLAPFGWLPEVGHVLATPIAALLAYLEQVAIVLAAVPTAAISVPYFPAWLGPAYYSALAGLIAAYRSDGGRRWLALILAAGVPIAIASGEVVAWRAQPASAVLLDVGEGQAVLLTGPGGRILIDGGPSSARLAAALGEQLAPWETDLAALVLTSPSLAHSGGLAGFERGAATVVLPAADLNGGAWRSIAATEVARGARIVPAGAGQRLALAGLKVEVLAPEPGAPADEPGAADLAVRISLAGGPAFCDLSDLDPQAQLQAAARLTGPCEYLLLPDEGRSSPAPELLRAARPKVLLVSGAAKLARDLPAGNLRRTAQEGSIQVALR